jgi:hypothetical protein
MAILPAFHSPVFILDTSDVRQLSVLVPSFLLLDKFVNLSHSFARFPARYHWKLIHVVSVTCATLSTACYRLLILSEAFARLLAVCWKPVDISTGDTCYLIRKLVTSYRPDGEGLWTVVWTKKVRRGLKIAESTTPLSSEQFAGCVVVSVVI